MTEPTTPTTQNSFNNMYEHPWQQHIYDLKNVFCDTAVKKLKAYEGKYRQ